MELPDDFFENSDYNDLSDHEKDMVEKKIIEDAFENSYRVITKKTTFDDLMDSVSTGNLSSALMAHNPEENPKKEILENMILHFSSEEYEEYDKCVELKSELNRLYPETIGKLII
jgi:hypothetical protein